MSVETLFSVIIGILGLGFLLLGARVWQLERQLRVLFRGKRAKDLEEVMVNVCTELERIQKAVGTVESQLGHVEGRLQRSVQGVGVVRFNPFRDAGSDQSFVAAFLDEGRNGVVISSLYARDGVRVYGKPIERGISPYTLSVEEKEAIKRAIGSQSSAS